MIKSLVTLAISLLYVVPSFGQSEIRVEPPTGRLGWLLNPYRPRSVPPIRVTNSSRLDSLIRAGNLYLSAPDVVALAIENNIDVEVQRYGPLLGQEELRRAKAGGALRGVALGIAQGPQSVSSQGVTVTGAGFISTAGSGVSSGGGIVTQLGPLIPSFDPTVPPVALPNHATIPQRNTILTRP